MLRALGASARLVGPTGNGRFPEPIPGRSRSRLLSVRSVGSQVQTVPVSYSLCFHTTPARHTLFLLVFVITGASVLVAQEEKPGREYDKKKKKEQCEKGTVSASRKDFVDSEQINETVQLFLLMIVSKQCKPAVFI